MPFEFPCNPCGKQLRVGDQLVGKQVRCPSCGAIQVAQPNTPTAPFQTPPFKADHGPQDDPQSLYVARMIAENKIAGPATTLMIYSGLALGIMALVFLVGLFPGAARGDRVEYTVLLSPQLFIYGFILFGSWGMAHLHHYKISMATAIVAMLPCGVCWFIGLPLGIWAVVVLNDPEVKRAFDLG
jgi:hypothetical protein